MAAPTYLTTYCPENPEDCADQHEHHPDHPQDGNAGQEPDQQQYEPDDDHEVTRPSFDSIGDICFSLPRRAHIKQTDALDVGELDGRFGALRYGHSRLALP